MIAPEVCNFPAPACYFQIDKNNKISETACRLNTFIQNHSFNHQVGVFLPNVAIVSQDIVNSLTVDSTYYKILNVPLSEFTQKEFIEGFVNNGELTALSINTKLDTDDCFCLLPKGVIRLSLTKVTYEELGIEGISSFYSCSQPADRYSINIELKTESLKPGKRNCKKLNRCLSQGRNIKFDIIASWEPPDNVTCPSTLAAYFHKLGYKVSACEPKFLQCQSSDVIVPPITTCHIEELVEWIGMFCTQADLSGTSDTFISRYQPPTVQISGRPVTYLQCTGFFTSKQIERLIVVIREHAQCDPFTAIHVQGFDDSPVSWEQHEHSFFQIGDNSYTLFLHDTSRFTIHQVIGARRKPFTRSKTKRVVKNRDMEHVFA